MEWFIRDLSDKYFAEATPQNYKVASKTFGTGTNGTLTIKASEPTTTAKIAFVVADAKSTGMSVAESGGTITVTLGTTSDTTVTVDSTATTGANTVKKIAEAINASAACKALGITAEYSGTGATAYTTAAAAAALTAGTSGTPCSEIGTAFVNNGTYYVCLKADGTDKNDGWYSFTLNAV